MLVRYRGTIIKVSWRDPGQNGRFWGPFLVLWNVNFESTRCWKVKNVEKLTFRCHVKPNRLKICMYDRMLGAVTLETSKPPQFQLELPKKRILWKNIFFNFVFCQRWTSMLVYNLHQTNGSVKQLSFLLGRPAGPPDPPGFTWGGAPAPPHPPTFFVGLRPHQKFRLLNGVTCFAHVRDMRHLVTDLAQLW